MPPAISSSLAGTTEAAEICDYSFARGARLAMNPELEALLDDGWSIVFLYSQL